VPVEEHKARGSITYVLKNAGARVWNNTNALVTVHFNTPVSRARLVPRGEARGQADGGRASGPRRARKTDASAPAASISWSGSAGTCTGAGGPEALNQLFLTTSTTD
jgi:hypothetical protein